MPVNFDEIHFTSYYCPNKKEKSMCTTAAKVLNKSWFLLKTRDPVGWMRWDDEIKLFNSSDDQYRKLIVQNPDPHEDGYYGGINEKGVAFVSTFVKVAENQISYIRRPYVRLILDAPTAKDAVEIIKSFNPKIGGNMFVADDYDCFGIEGSPKKYFIEKIKHQAVKTNHFLKLPDVNLDFKSEPGFKAWSETHYHRAQNLIADASSLEALKSLLKDRKHADQKMAICTTSKEEKCYTHSAFIFDTKQIKAYYTQGNPLKVPFNEYGF
jgi:predicted choloylglycine hydrolase